MNDHIDPHSAALYAIIAVCLVLLGAVISIGPLTLEQRATVLAGIFTALVFVVYRARRHTPGGE